MQVPAATMRVAHTFDVVRQATVAAVVRLVYVDPICLHLVDCSPNPKPRPYLHLWGGVGVLLLCLISPANLRLCCGGGAFLRLGCCQCLAAGICGWGEGALWWC